MNYDVADENIYGVIKKEKYIVGYVAAIDVLGFTGYICENDGNYHKARNMMNLIAANKRMYENNFDHIRFTICSDTIFVTIEVNDELKFDYAFFQSIVTKIGLIRSIILNEVGLMSRAGITFGKYAISSEGSNVIFGPAIIRAVRLAEHIDEFEGINADYSERPAAIIIDNLFTKYPDEEIDNEFLNGGTKNYIEENYCFEHIGYGFYVYNPFFEDYEDHKTRNNLCDEEYRISDYWAYYVDKCKKQLAFIKETHPEKVTNEERLFNHFLERKKKDLS